MDRLTCIACRPLTPGWLIYHKPSRALILLHPACRAYALIAPTDEAGIFEIVDAQPSIPRRVLDESVALPASLAALSLIDMRYNIEELLDSLSEVDRRVEEQLPIVVEYLLYRVLESRSPPRTPEDIVTRVEKLAFIALCMREEDGRLVFEDTSKWLVKDWIVAWTGPESPLVRLVAYTLVLGLLDKLGYRACTDDGRGTPPLPTPRGHL